MMRLDFFSWAYNGLELSCSFQQALMDGGVEIESLNYSDTRLEWDLALGFEGKRFRGHVGTDFSFSCIDTVGHHYSMSYYVPLTLETALYQVFCVLKGERIDASRVVGGTVIQWMD